MELNGIVFNVLKQDFQLPEGISKEREKLSQVREKYQKSKFDPIKGVRILT